MGEGEWHDCGEDCCSCLEPEPNVTCDVCDGTGELGFAEGDDECGYDDEDEASP